VHGSRLRRRLVTATHWRQRRMARRPSAFHQESLTRILIRFTAGPWARHSRIGCSVRHSIPFSSRVRSEHGMARGSLDSTISGPTEVPTAASVSAVRGDTHRPDHRPCALLPRMRPDLEVDPPRATLISKPHQLVADRLVTVAGESVFERYHAAPRADARERRYPVSARSCSSWASME
jgi:hypothetical protein